MSPALSDCALGARCPLDASSEDTDRMGNPVVHFELIGPDPSRLREFYAQLFGWDAPAGAPVADRVSTPTEYSLGFTTSKRPVAATGRRVRRRASEPRSVCDR